MYSRFVIISRAVSLLLLKSVSLVCSADIFEQTDSEALTNQRHLETPVFDQENIASSTACAVTTAMMQASETSASPNLFDYYQTRESTLRN